MAIEHLQTVPHLTVAPSGPVLAMEQQFLDKQIEIETWFREQWQQAPAPFYSSVDLRNAGFKLAPVDTNLFPAGFNNLNPAFMPLCIQAVQSAIEKYCPSACRVLIIPENHSRNQFYFASLEILQNIVRHAGYDVRIGTFRTDITQSTVVEYGVRQSLILEPLRRNGDKLELENFSPCLIICNNDLSGGTPEILINVQQPILPNINLSWIHRTKTSHFGHYTEQAQKFAHAISIDPWLITPLFRNCGEVNFRTGQGQECLQKNATSLLQEIRNKYAQFGIKEEPFIVVKADSGTYGMGVMSIRDPSELLNLNRKQRTRMSASKDGVEISRVILQEGIYTFERWGNDQAVAEPVVYLIDHFVVGGFYRVHKNRSPTENLNAPGMHFEPLAFAEPCNTPDSQRSASATPNRFYAYGVIARLAALAAAHEQLEIAGR
jgi:glutamate--cysteine ligase